MKQLNLCLLLVGFNLVSILSLGQSRPTPVEVTNTFNKMFPNASDLQWKDKIINFSAFFNIKGSKCEAKFTPAGSWISTEEVIQWDSLPRLVTDSLKSCKYGDWKGTSAYILQESNGTTQYHVVVTKSDMGRKILFFNASGQLLADH